MEGLVCRALENFVTDLHGAEVWSAAIGAAGIRLPGPSESWVVPNRHAPALCRAAADLTGQPPEELAADLGVWLVTAPATAPIRRLLRFGGHDFAEFLMSLEELSGRAALAVPAFMLPDVSVEFDAGGVATIDVGRGMPYYPALLEGVVRAMADDYGVLAWAERAPAPPDARTQLTVRLHDPAFAKARRFALSGAAE